MNTVTNIDLNLSTPLYSTVYAVQGDVLSRKIAARLFDGTAPWTPPAGALCVIRYIKPDGTVGFYDADENDDPAYTISGNLITFVLAAQALTVPGTVRLQLNFYTADNEKLSTFTMALEVSPEVVADGQVMSEDYIAELAGAVSRAETAAGTAETSAASAQADAAAAAIAKNYAQTFTGAPLAAATAAGMTDHTRIYVYTGTTGGGLTNGHWYYWGGSAWADGGVYNSVAVQTDPTLTVAGAPADAAACGDLKSALSDAREYYLPLDKKNVFGDAILLAANTYCGINNGELYLGSAPSMDTYILPVNGQSIYTFSHSIPYFVRLGIDKKTAYSSGTSATTITPVGCYYLAISILKTDISTLKVSCVFNNSNYIKKKTQAVQITSDHPGYFISNTGSKLQVADFAYTNPIHFDACNRIILHARGYLTSVAMISTCDENGNNIEPVVVSRSNVVEDYVYDITESCYVIFCWYVPDGETTTLLVDSIEAIAETVKKQVTEISELDTRVSGFSTNIAGAFKNVMFIGDSLTHSAVSISNDSFRQAYVTYPQAFCKLTGATPYPVAHVGYSAKDIWDNYQNSIISRDDQLCVLYAGTNGGLTDTIDTDLSGDDYTQWADTNTGSYGKIIAKAQDAGAKVVLIKLYAGPSFNVTNSVIDKMGIKFNVPVIDSIYFDGNQFHYYPPTNILDSVHYNDFGYASFAKTLYDRINNLSANDIVKIIPG